MAAERRIVAVFGEVEQNPQLSGIEESTRLCRVYAADGVIGMEGAAAQWLPAVRMSAAKHGAMEIAARIRGEDPENPNDPEEPDEDPEDEDDPEDPEDPEEEETPEALAAAMRRVQQRATITAAGRKQLESSERKRREAIAARAAAIAAAAELAGW